MTRTALATLVMLLAAAGCHKPAASNAIPGVAPPPPAPPAAASDYRLLNVQEIEKLIRDTTGSPVKLTATGPNKYTGTRQSPDGTAQLQVAVTVEAERVVIETKGGGMSAREFITVHGLQVEGVR